MSKKPKLATVGRELSPFYAEIKTILQQARSKAQTAVNSAMVEAYWLIGKRIVEEEQQGKTRAEYGKQIIKKLAKMLSNEFGKGLDERELRRLRQFYLCFSKWDTVRPELSWSHYRLLIRVSSEQTRSYYLNEATEQQWSYRTLERNYKTLYHERLLSSQNKTSVEKEMQDKTAQLQATLLDNLQNFLFELGTCPRIKNLLRKIHFGHLFSSFSLNSRAIRLKCTKNLTQNDSLSSRFSFSDRLLGLVG